MRGDQPQVFLLDIDNTLIDHDELKRQVAAWIDDRVVQPRSGEFWETYEAVRRELGIVDFMEAARRFEDLCGPEPLDGLGRFLWGFPFDDLLLPGTRPGWERLAQTGPLAVLCDGERRFQEQKLERIGLLPLLEHVFVFDHKEDHLGEVERRFPGANFVMFDDKPRILRAMEQRLGSRLHAVHVRHGHYAGETFAGRSVDSIAGY
ncbi:MAG: HAD family hydrolase [Dehalococcoidia bacterium]|uniref:HAD family hydrolase n=1 Tax=Candidatus Amarobacter glycogenicus TaxID=3140699 RepID=UPI003136A34A|nr:HAD family hydrolase [Dehalococcoidia bacterium]